MINPLKLNKHLEDIPLQWKLYIAISSLLLVLGLTIIFVVDQKATYYFHQDHYKDASSIGRVLASNAVKPILTNDRVNLHTLLADVLQTQTDLKYAYISTRSKQILAHTFIEGFPSDLLDLTITDLSNQVIHREISTDEGVIHEAIVPILEGDLGYVYMGMSLEGMVQSISDINSALIAITIFICFIGLIASVILNRLITKPISSLVSATEKIGKGDLAVNLATERNDEIGILTNSFNQMANALKSNMDKRKISERALRDSKELYMSLIEGIELGITFIDKDHNIILANTAQAKMFGVDKEQVIGAKCFQEYGSKSDRCKNCPGVVAMHEDRAVIKEAKRTRKDGTTFTIRTNSFPVRNNLGENIGFIEVVEDISEQLHLHKELQKIENIESIGHLAAGLAHDFNNLLAAILGNIELARTTIPPEESAFERLNSAEEACEQARILANQLLTFSKGGDPQKISTPIPQLLENCCQFSLSGSSQKLVIDAPKRIWPVDLDQGQMGQVFQGLLINAKEASSSSGKIFVIAENVEIEDADNIPLTNGMYVKISIEDEGHGIKEEDLPKIFDPYFTTKEIGAKKGTGLGLTISHSVIKKHNGHISIKSKEGHGTTITIYLPKSNSAPPTSFTPDNSQTSTSTDNYRILLLEDDGDLAKTTANMLIHLRHKFEIAATGEEAIAMHLQAVDEAQPYDILILDLTIRGGLGGKETMQKIRETDQKVRAIVSSGYSDDPVVVNFNDYGFNSALPKPFTLPELESAIREATVPVKSASS